MQFNTRQLCTANWAQLMKFTIQTRTSLKRTLLRLESVLFLQNLRCWLMMNAKVAAPKFEWKYGSSHNLMLDPPMFSDKNWDMFCLLPFEIHFLRELKRFQWTAKALHHQASCWYFDLKWKKRIWNIAKKSEKSRKFLASVLSKLKPNK